MLEFRNISKSFNELEVLKDVSLNIRQGEIATILGPSGAGKTTLLQIGGTLMRPDSGEVLYNGISTAGLNDKKLSEFRNQNIGFIFQFHQLLAEFTARENVAIPAMIGGMSRKKALLQADELLNMLGLNDRRNHKPSALSGGERQRTAVARALINRPSVVFADEPTGALDSHNRDEIIDMFLTLRQQLGQTFVIVTHDPTLSKCADSVIKMVDGKAYTEII